MTLVKNVMYCHVRRGSVTSKWRGLGLVTRIYSLLERLQPQQIKSLGTPGALVHVSLQCSFLEVLLICWTPLVCFLVRSDLFCVESKSVFFWSGPFCQTNSGTLLLGDPDTAVDFISVETYLCLGYYGHVTIYKIWGFHGGDYEEWRLLGCYAMWFL
jgi:hypothetical protein